MCEHYVLEMIIIIIWIVMHSAIDTINPAVAGCFLIVG